MATARHQRLRAGAVRKARGAGNGSGSTPAAASNSGGCSTSKYFGHRPAPVHEMTAPRGRSRLHQDVFGHPLDTIFRWAAKLLDFAGAPYGTERVASEPTVKSALFGLFCRCVGTTKGDHRQPPRSCGASDFHSRVNTRPTCTACHDPRFDRRAGRDVRGARRGPATTRAQTREAQLGYQLPQLSTAPAPAAPSLRTMERRLVLGRYGC